jgi:hypothetical protein
LLRVRSLAPRVKLQHPTAPRGDHVVGQPLAPTFALQELTVLESSADTADIGRLGLVVKDGLAEKVFRPHVISVREIDEL